MAHFHIAIRTGGRSFGVLRADGGTSGSREALDVVARGSNAARREHVLDVRHDARGVGRRGREVTRGPPEIQSNTLEWTKGELGTS